MTVDGPHLKGCPGATSTIPIAADPHKHHGGPHAHALLDIGPPRLVALGLGVQWEPAPDAVARRVAAPDGLVRHDDEPEPRAVRVAPVAALDGGRGPPALVGPLGGGPRAK